MKKRMSTILTMCCGIFICISSFAQTAPNWSDVIAEEKGDIVVVKGYESSSFFNTLLTAVKGDTLPDGTRTNPNRIYETIPGETYISDVTLELDATVPFLHITAPLPGPGIKPPMHIRAKKQDNTFDKTFFQSPGSTLMENQYFLHVTINDTYEEREFMRTQGIGTRHEYHNCVWELTNWTHHNIQANRQTFKYIDCKFLNVGNEATLEKGCVLETRTVPPDTVWMENCTFLNGGILTLGLEQTGPLHVYMNHNTIVNCSQPPFCYSTTAEMIVTNNLIINSGFVADYPEFYTLFDDDDLLPKGIINMDTMETVWLNNWYLSEDSVSWFYPVEEADRKVLFDKNSIWWDPRFEDMVNNQMPDIPADIGDYEWMSQMILMNDRTKAMFDDDASYPYYNEGENLNIEPDFANNEDLVDEWVSYVITNSTPGLPNGGDPMPKWRTNQNSLIYLADWPMLSDLTYTNADLLQAGLKGYPMGDLNWYPEEKSNWEATGESETLWAALKSGTLPTGIERNEIQNTQLSVYPNPTTNTMNVQFELTGGSNVELNIYNLIGMKVMSKDLGYRMNGSHRVTLDKGNLTSGMYILQLDAENMDRVSTKITIK